MQDRLKQFVIELASRGLTIGTAEQCTCGLLGASLGSVCGTKSLYKGTITACDEKGLNTLLDVSENSINSFGMVSSSVAMNMSIGALYKLDVDFCIAVVGNLESGVICICSARRKGKSMDFNYKNLLLDGTKSENIEKTIVEALELAYKHIMLKEEKEDE